MRKSLIKDPSLIEPITVIKCTKQIHQSQHNHGPLDQANHGQVVGGSITKIRGGRTEYSNSWRQPSTRVLDAIETPFRLNDTSKALLQP